MGLEVPFSFDPAKMLPESLQHYSAKVIDDCGSSVLIEMQPLSVRVPSVIPSDDMLEWQAFERRMLWPMESLLGKQQWHPELNA